MAYWKITRRPETTQYQSADPRDIDTWYNPADPAAYRQKFKTPPNPVAAEAALKEMMPPPAVMAAETARRFKQLRDNEVGDQAGQFALAAEAFKGERERVERSVQDAFIADFRRWCATPQLAYPGAAPELPNRSRHPSVAGYLALSVERKAQFQKAIARLKLEGETYGMSNWDIERLWLYYKFVERGMEPTDAEAASMIAAWGPDAPVPRRNAAMDAARAAGYPPSAYVVSSQSLPQAPSAPTVQPGSNMASAAAAPVPPGAVPGPVTASLNPGDFPPMARGVYDNMQRGTPGTPGAIDAMQRRLDQLRQQATQLSAGRSASTRTPPASPVPSPPVAPATLASPQSPPRFSLDALKGPNSQPQAAVDVVPGVEVRPGGELEIDAAHIGSVTLTDAQEKTLTEQIGQEGVQAVDKAALDAAIEASAVAAPLPPEHGTPRRGRSAAAAEAAAAAAAHTPLPASPDADPPTGLTPEPKELGDLHSKTITRKLKDAGVSAFQIRAEKARPQSYEETVIAVAASNLSPLNRIQRAYAEAAMEKAKKRAEGTDADEPALARHILKDLWDRQARDR